MLELTALVMVGAKRVSAPVVLPQHLRRVLPGLGQLVLLLHLQAAAGAAASLAARSRGLPVYLTASPRQWTCPRPGQTV